MPFDLWFFPSRDSPHWDLCLSPPGRAPGECGSTCGGLPVKRFFWGTKTRRQDGEIEAGPEFITFYWDSWTLKSNKMQKSRSWFGSLGDVLFFLFEAKVLFQDHPRHTWPDLCIFAGEKTNDHRTKHHLPFLHGLQTDPCLRSPLWVRVLRFGFGTSPIAECFNGTWGISRRLGEVVVYWGIWVERRFLDHWGVDWGRLGFFWLVVLFSLRKCFSDEEFDIFAFWEEHQGLFIMKRHWERSVLSPSLFFAKVP